MRRRRNNQRLQALINFVKKFKSVLFNKEVEVLSDSETDSNDHPYLSLK